MAAAVDRLDAYRPATLSIVHLYASDAVLERGCNGQATVIGRSALTEYLRQWFDEKPAGELQGLQMAGDMVVVVEEITKQSDEQDWLDGEMSPARTGDGTTFLTSRRRQRQIARNNPVCEPVSLAGHSVRAVARRGPRLNPMPPRGRGAVSANRTIPRRFGAMCQERPGSGRVKVD